MATDLVKRYTYRVYNASTNSYLGMFSNVLSDFGYTQQINNAAAELPIILGNTFDDVGAVQTDEFWIDESGNKFVDESGNHIVFSAVFSFNSIPIDLGNRIKVYAEYDGAPAGTQVFDGFISRWRSSYSQNTIELSVLSWGVQLDNYLIATNPTGQTIDQEVYDKSYSLDYTSDFGATNKLAQSFNIASSTVVGAVTVFVAGSDPFDRTIKGVVVEHVVPISYMPWQLYAGTPSSPGSLIDSGLATFQGSNVRQVTLQFTKPFTLSGNYFIVMGNASAGSYYYGAVSISATSTNPYAGGTVFTSTDMGASWSAVAADDIAFIVQSSTGGTDLTFTNSDPSLILQRILDQLNAQGGIISYTSSSIDLTVSSSNYTYSVQTILEGIQRVLALSPDGWYWYLDVATNLLHFHRIADTVAHRFILGNHIVDLDLEYSLEEVVNTVYFSGGPTAGVNLYIAQKNPVSAQRYGQFIERISDNRVTDSTAAATIVSGELAAKSEPAFHTELKIHSSTYDIETIDIGDTIGLRGFNNLIDTLVFQVVQKVVTPDVVTLTIGTLPPRASSTLEEVRRRLDALETLDNPTAPS